MKIESDKYNLDNSNELFLEEKNLRQNKKFTEKELIIKAKEEKEEFQSKIPLKFP